MSTFFRIISKGRFNRDMSELKSFKYKSKIATAISFIAAFIAYIGRDGLAEVMPAEYAYLVPIIVFLAGYILSQSTENTRVDVAEQLIKQQYEKNTAPENSDENIVVNLTLDGEEVIKEEEDTSEDVIVDDGGA